MSYLRTAASSAAIVMSLCLAGAPTVGAWSVVENGLNQSEMQSLEPALAVVSAAEPQTQTEPDISAVWQGADRWMRGINWGGETFFNSIGKGKNFFGSNVADNSYFPVVLEFSNTTTSQCRTFRRDLGYASSGVGTFPGAAYDMTDPGTPRRLNICFVEDNTLGAANLTWDPTTSSTAKREYVFIMTTDYDGDGSTYNGFNIFSGASTMPIIYAWWPQLEVGKTLLQTLPAQINIDAYYVKNLHGIPEATQMNLSWAYFGANPAWFRILSGPASASTVLDSVPGTERTYTHTGLSNGTTNFYRVQAVDGSSATVAQSAERSFTTANMASNMLLAGHWNERSTYGGIWGYTDSLGNEYALLCARNEGVSIIDINTLPPTEVGFMPSITPAKDAKEVKVYGHYAVIVKENEKLQIFDISDVTNPIQVGTMTPDSSTGRVAGSHNVLVDGNYAYVVGNHGTGGLEIFDISNPASPVEILPGFQPFYYHDIAIRNDTIYAAGIYGDGIDIIDVTNKAAPFLVKRFNYSGSGAHNMDLSADGKYIYISDEIGVSGNWTRIFDLNDLNNIQEIAQIIVDPAAVAHNCYRKDTLLYQAYYTEGVRVWSVANPASPYEVAYYDTYQPAAYGYLGCWTVYPFFASGKLVASDMQSGLYVLELDVPPPPGCCVGTTGNVNDDVGEQIDISDLSLLISYLTVSPRPTLPCPEEANVNANAVGVPPYVDISDLSLLISYLTVTPRPALPNCP
ncbi:MAG: choice-of-anchor B family protein [candidate division Zixibacteria bacterium]|nr:choice-of-anchor B family protein [candidate division Zixibacteria bacterium]